MKTTKKVHKRSKKVLGRKPEYSYYVRELIKEEVFPGGPKKFTEKVYTVDSFCYHGNYNR